MGLIINRRLARDFSTIGVGCSAEASTALFGASWQEEEKYSIIHCGIDLERFQQQSTLRDSLGIGPDEKVIGHVSNFSIAKNPLFLGEVLASVLRTREDIRLLLVGDGILRPALEKKLGELGIRSRVIFAGSRPDVPELMCSAMDMFLMPSVHEGLPLVLLEAQAAGLSCLVSDVVSREAEAVPGAVQFMPLTAGADAWAEAVIATLGKSRSQADALRIMKESDFNIDVSARRLAGLYEPARAVVPNPQ